jgi:hypothetical protein
MPIDSRRASIINDNAKGSRRIIGRFALPSSSAADPQFSQNIFDRVRKLLLENAIIIGISKESSDLQKGSLDAYENGTILKFEQLFRGDVVDGATIIVKVGNENSVLSITVSMILKRSGQPNDPVGQGINVIDPICEINKQLQDVEALSGITEVRFNKDGILRPAYLVIIAKKDSNKKLRVLVDRYNGEILQQTELALKFPIVDAFLFFPNATVVNNERLQIAQPRNNQKSLININNIRRAFPLDLIDVTDNDVTLDGTYVRVDHPERLMRKKGILDFPADSRAFQQIMAFYHIDWFQRYIIGLGFSRYKFKIDVEINFLQVSPMAYYDMIDQKIVFGQPSGPGDNYPSEDGEMITHEYTHALIDILTDRQDSTLGSEYNALSEGIALVMPCILFSHLHTKNEDCLGCWTYFVKPPSIDNTNGLGTYDAWIQNIQNNGFTAGSSPTYIGGMILSSVLWKVYQDLGGSSRNPTTKSRARDDFVKMLLLNWQLSKLTTFREFAQVLLENNSEDDSLRGKDTRVILKQLLKGGILCNSMNADPLVEKPGFDADNWYFLGENPSLSTLNQASFWFEKRDDGFFLCVEVTNNGNEVMSNAIVTARLQFPGMNVQFEDTRSVPVYNVSEKGGSTIVQIKFANKTETELSQAKVTVKISYPYMDRNGEIKYKNKNYSYGPPIP